MINFKEALAGNLETILQRLHAVHIDEAHKNWVVYIEGTSLVPNRDANDNENSKNIIVEFLLHELASVFNEMEQLRTRYQRFLTDIRNEQKPKDQQLLILDFCRYLGTKNIRKDAKAFSRWFDIDATTERWQKKLRDKEAYVIFLLQRISHLFDLVLHQEDRSEHLAIWMTFKFEKRLLCWLQYHQQPQVQIEAFKCLSSTIELLAAENFENLSPELIRYIYRYALDSSQPSKLQIEALNLLAIADIKQTIKLLKIRLDQQQHPDDIFFREAITEIVNIFHFSEPELLKFIPILTRDTSPLVRASVVNCIPVLPETEQQQAKQALATDQSDSVYTSLISKLPFLYTGTGLIDFYLKQLSILITPTTEKQLKEVRIRVLLHALPDLFLQFHTDTEQAELARAEVCLGNLSQITPNPKVQYWLVVTRERLWAMQQSDLELSLASLLTLSLSKKVQLTPEQRQHLSTERGKRWLSAKVDQGFSLEIADKWVRRGDRFGFRLWRFLHELKHPATDKRQHHSHVTGRTYFTHNYVAAPYVAEVSQTRVPGEPLHMSEEGHWRPFLPLVDQFISSLDQGWPTRSVNIYHVTGITRIVPPSSLFKRLVARTLLTTRFRHYAELRNWHAQSAHKPQHYLNEIRKLGFTVEHNTFTSEFTATPYPELPAVKHFFQIAVPLNLVTLWEDFQQYFVSVYQNSLTHLMYFLFGIITLFWGNHLWVTAKVRRARKKIPLVIGGWGTRGKSGTERLKAAIFNALGFSVISKTTGCEAMFLYGNRNSQLKEMFLFRPYDKATIWEQAYITQVTAAINADVLLWECMGLTPRYIDILQQQWMQDDISTITNCFPDHEDIQGPAGIDIPQVIARFIPPKAEVYSTEENMSAYLVDEAKRKKTQLIPVDWVDIATLPEDLLSRFPYEEHPANIALVAKMAERFGLNKTMAIKEMADRVVADIGVLKVFPVSQIAERRLQFINGMSANERFGALSNWNRLNLDKVGYNAKRYQFVATVINNRADRVARSKVFAQLISNELSADIHFVIGDNLDGFKQYVSGAWKTFLKAQALSTKTPQLLNETCLSLAEFLRIPTTPTALWKVTTTLLEDMQLTLPTSIQIPMPDSLMASQYKDELTSQLENLKRRTESTEIEQAGFDYVLTLIEKFDAFTTLITQINNETLPVISKQLEAFFTQQFMRRFCYIDNYFISGDQLIKAIAEKVPPYLHCHLMGMQNIKGTGLGFVYCWQQWEKVHTSVEKLLSSSLQEEIEQECQSLLSFNHFGVLEHEYLLTQLEQFKQDPKAQRENIQVELDAILYKIKLNQKQQKENTSNKSSPFSGIISAIEKFLDVGDAIKRSKRATLITNDLIEQRISLNRAAYELQKINKKQKGGWLQEQFNNR